MRRHTGICMRGSKDSESNLDGLFLVRVERAADQWHRRRSFLELRFIKRIACPLWTMSAPPLSPSSSRNKGRPSRE